MPQEALTCTELLLDHLGTSDDFENFTYYSNFVDQRLDYLNNMLKANKLMHLIKMPQQENKNNNQIRNSYIKDIQNIIEVTGSDRVRYNYLLIMFEHFYKKNEFILAKDAAISIQELFHNSPIFQSNTNTAGAKYNIALVDSRLGNFNEAASLLESALKPFNPNSLNSLNIKTNLFCIYLNLKLFDKARRINQEIQNHRILIEKPYDIASLKNDYHLAYLYFLEADYQKSIISLHKCDSLDKLNKTWYWASLLLEVIILIEQDLFEIAETRIRGLQRILSRSKLHAPRIRYIVKTLRGALKNHAKVRELLEKHTLRQRPQIGLPPSDPFGYEIIAFETWVKTYCSRESITA